MKDAIRAATATVLLALALGAPAQTGEGSPAGSGSEPGPQSDESRLDAPAKKLSYIIGYQVARNVSERLGAQGVTLDLEAFDVGLRDGLAESPPRITEAELRAAIEALQASRVAEQSEEAEENLQAGREFLTENAKEKDVVVLASGLQYKELEAGTGARPKPGATVMVHYQGTLIDGEVFDSSIERGQPARFSTDGVIPGFREALTNMREGAKWRVFIPSELAYGERGAGAAIGPNQALIFDLELIEVISEE